MVGQVHVSSKNTNIHQSGRFSLHSIAQVKGQVEPAEETRKQILKRYDSNPGGWRVLVGRDRRGHYDLIVSHGSDVWFIKEEQINPFRSVGFGLRDKVADQDVVEKLSPVTFGLRPLSKTQMTRIASALRSENSLSEVLSKFLKTDPVAFSEVSSPGLLQGPIIHAPRGIGLISERQAELDRELRVELERLLMRKYPQTIATYV